ncbi:hypothetical protein ACY3C4_000507 [Campylobacter coli]
MQNITSNLIFTNEQVASNYGLTTGLTIAKHLRMHNDEFIENTHYFLVENSFKNKTIKWTLEGVYKLFDKIKKLKERNKMAEEKESKGSNIVQIRLSDKQKDELQKKADEVGLPLTQYIIFLITKDLKAL